MLKDLAEGIHGDLRIGACITAANAILPRPLGLYRHKYPHVGLVLEPGNSPDIIESLQRGEIDIAFVASDRLPADIASLAEIPDELVLFAAPNHRMALKRTLKPEDLSSCDFIQREASSDTHGMVMRWLAAESVEIRTLMDVW
jgi:DNA-binding transcriptional LysR family regulator